MEVRLNGKLQKKEYSFRWVVNNSMLWQLAYTRANIRKIFYNFFFVDSSGTDKTTDQE